jgi:CRP/FNR family transcriptional regulator, anaerobic regulatory protein
MPLVNAHSCDKCVVRNRALCGALGPEDLAKLAQITHKKHFEPGQTILAEDEIPDCFANIVSGVVKLTKMLADGRQQIVGLQFASDFLGRPYRPRAPYFAEAATDVELCCFPIADFNKVLKATPELEHRLFETTLDELDAARDWMLILGQKTAQEKVASFIYLLARRTEQTGCAHSRFEESHEIRITLPLTRADMGDFLGLTIETVSRQMTKLKQQGIIKLDGLRTIVVPDVRRLAMIAES